MPIKDPEKRKAYHRKYMREWYVKNKAKHLDLVAKNRRRISDLVNDYKLERGCADCGYATHAVVLDFDHCLGEKSFSISKAVNMSYGWARLLPEIEKCEVVCANCHRIRHHVVVD